MPMPFLMRRISVVLSFAMIGCKALTGDDAELPAGTNDPSTYNTPEGAVATYNQAVGQFQDAFQDYVLVSGMLTDEFQAREVLQSDPIHANNVGSDVLIDSRNMSTALALHFSNPSYTDQQYGKLNEARTQIAQAKGALAKYAPATSPALRGRLYALEGYLEIMLADLFCSNVPLSSLDFEKDYTLSAGLTSKQVYHHASAQFDTALALSADSVSIQMLARTGKGRALVAMDSLSEAASTVASVPDGFAYRFAVAWGSASPTTNQKYTRVQQSDREGLNGLPYVSSGDPRTTAAVVDTLALFPAKYSLIGYDTLNLADWIEARLIGAEANLATGGTGWLTTVNTLRTDGTFTTAVDPLNPAKTDTTWGLGTAHVPGQTQGVRLLRTPATASAAADSLFADRAFWLFATGHRQGDLRRFMRTPYNRRGADVYPTGGTAKIYPRQYHYGSDVSAPIPPTEYTNPKFHPEACVTNVS